MENVNGIFAEFAAAFVGKVRGPGDVAYAARLDRRALDYSVDSLQVVDQYLTFLHGRPPERVVAGWENAALWGGAYVGEVIARNARATYDWVDFDEFVGAYPDTTRLLGTEKQLPFCALLTRGGGHFLMPVNKVLRFIYDGPADSVHYFATAELAGE